MKKIFNMFLVLIILTITLNSAYANENLISLPEIGTLSGIDGTIQSVDFSHDDKYIVAGLSNGEVAIWDSKNMNLLMKLEAVNSERGVQKVIYNHNSSKIISSYDNATIKVWDVSTGKSLHTLDASKGTSNKGNIYDIAINSDSSILYSANENLNSIIFWDMNSGDILKEITLNNKPVSLSYNPNSNQIVVAIENEGLKIYDANSGSYISANSNKNLYTKAKYTSDYKKLFIPSSYNSKFGQPFIFDTDKNYESMTLEKNDYKRRVNNGYIDLNWYDFDISSNNRYTAITDHGVCIVDNNTKQVFADIDIKTNGPLKFNNDSSRLLAGNTLVDTSSLPNVVLKGIKIEIDSIDMNPDKIQNISIKELFSDGTSKNLPLESVDFVSSNPEVAEVLYRKLNSKKVGKSTITANYKGFTDKVEINVLNHKAFEKRLGIVKDKEWTIKFSMDINSDTISGENIYILDKNKEIVPVHYNSIKASENSVKIKPVNDLTSGESYTIWIKNLESKTGKKLKEFTKMDFQVK